MNKFLQTAICMVLSLTLFSTTGCAGAEIKTECVDNSPIVVENDVNTQELEAIEEKLRVLREEQNKERQRLEEEEAKRQEEEKKHLEMLGRKENDPDGKYFTEEQWKRLDTTNWSPYDLRLISTMTFWEVGRVHGTVKVQYPDVSLDWNEDDAYILKLYTAGVLFNRTVYCKLFDDSFYYNLVRPNQYSGSYTKLSGDYGTDNAYNNYLEYWEETVDACLDILTGEFEIEHDIIFQSNYKNLGKNHVIIQVPKGQGSTCYFAHGNMGY